MTMKTLYVSHDGGNNCNKRQFQKPNILRRRTKEPTRKPVVPRTFETTLVTVNSAPEQRTLLSCVPNEDRVLKCHTSVPLSESILQEHDSSADRLDVFDQNSSINISSKEPISSDVTGECVSQCAIINVESFLNDSTLVQGTPNDDINIRNSDLKSEWCLNFVDEQQQIIIENPASSQIARLHSADGSTIECIMPVSVLRPVESVDDTTADEVKARVGKLVTTSIVEEVIDTTGDFECDEPGCNKRFKTKLRVTRHKRTHLAGRKTPKEPRHITVECPARKKGALDTEPCGELFLDRQALAKHMQEDHVPEDAMYICPICNRRFFWRVGLRAHARAHELSTRSARALTCNWPGCGRQFRQPCRLREHQRAHTGDKPYPCSYPNCSWSFRTASKLVRHSRRHTGERRHACAVCGRAFPRREHLTKHAASHHAAQHQCTHHGCQRRFVTSEALNRHMRSRHKGDQLVITDDTHDANNSTWTDIFEDSECPEEQITIESTLSKPSTQTTNKQKAAETKKQANKTKGKAAKSKGLDEWKVYSTTSECDVQMKSREVDWQGFTTDTERETEWQVYDSPPAVPDPVHTDTDASDEREWHAARTHCTWPLAPRPASYTPHEDVQVELSEGSESNTYTIRSDLFLHGNLLTNEDSEHIPSVSVSLASTAADSGLSLLDAHPTTDLMQEDLMYSDAAVDESSFRVLLLNGDSNLY